MPPTNSDEGIRVAARLRETSPQTGVVALSQFDDATYAPRAVESLKRSYIAASRPGSSLWSRRRQPAQTRVASTTEKSRANILGDGANAG